MRKKPKNENLIYISRRVEEDLVQECDARMPNETGGILIGKTHVDGRTMITGIIGPGPKASHGRTSFRRDGEFAQLELNKVFERSNGEETYVGEWHSHPEECGPSFVDTNSIKWVSKNKDYECKNPILIIVTRSAGDWVLNAFCFVEKELKPSALKQAV